MAAPRGGPGGLAPVRAERGAVVLLPVVPADGPGPVGSGRLVRAGPRGRGGTGGRGAGGRVRSWAAPGRRWGTGGAGRGSGSVPGGRGRAPPVRHCRRQARTRRRTTASHLARRQVPRSRPLAAGRRL